MSVIINGRWVDLIEAPGFNDTNRTGDVDVLQEVTDWFARVYKSARTLSGIFYMHSMITPKMTGALSRNIRGFQDLVGSDNFTNVIFATSMWDRLDPIQTGERREARPNAE